MSEPYSVEKYHRRAKIAKPNSFAFNCVAAKNRSGFTSNGTINDSKSTLTCERFWGGLTLLLSLSVHDTTFGHVG